MAPVFALLQEVEEKRGGGPLGWGALVGGAGAAARVPAAHQLDNSLAISRTVSPHP